MKNALKIPGRTSIVIAIAIGIGAAGILSFFSNRSETPSQCEDSMARLAKMHVEEISLLNDSGKIIKFESYIADDGGERAAGYQHICEEVINETTILFVYSQPVKSQFHMQNVKAPLDIGFFDGAGRLIRSMVMDTYDDGNTRLYGPSEQFQYALEAPVGFFKAHKLSEGGARLVVHSVGD